MDPKKLRTAIIKSSKHIHKSKSKIKYLHSFAPFEGIRLIVTKTDIEIIGIDQDKIVIAYYFDICPYYPIDVLVAPRPLRALLKLDTKQPVDIFMQDYDLVFHQGNMRTTLRTYEGYLQESISLGDYRILGPMEENEVKWLELIHR